MVIAFLDMSIKVKGLYYIQSDFDTYREKWHMDNLRYTWKTNFDTAKDAGKRAKELISLLEIGNVLKLEDTISKDTSYVVLNVSEETITLLDVYDDELENLKAGRLELREHMILDCDYGEYLRFDFHRKGCIEADKANSFYIRNLLCQQ